VKHLLGPELHEFIDAQNARFALLMNNEGVDYTSSSIGPAETGTTSAGIRIRGNRLAFKTFVTNMISQLDPIINGY